MTRFGIVLILAFAVTLHPAFAGAVAPFRPFVVFPEPAEPDETPDADLDPVKLAERIAKNVRTAGDQLKAQDPGTAAQTAQAAALRDIDKLLEQAENPPPSGGGGGSPPPPPPDGGGSPPPPPQGGGGGSPPPQGSGQNQGQGQQVQPPPQGGGREPGSWRDKAAANGEPEPGAGEQPQPMPPGNEGPTPAGESANGEPKDTGPTGGAPGTAGPSKPGLPAEDAIAKQVWGHLPERLRQEMNQYYKEQFMPKYADLLKNYYANLAERDKGVRK